MSDNNNNNNFLGMMAPQVAGGVLGMALGGQTDKRQYDMANRVGRLNNILGMEMGNYNYNKQLEMWKATGPLGQMEQLKKAGLNPALMYGKSGPGGMLAAPATPGHANAGNANAGIEAGMGMQLATGLQQAQIENLKADTAKKQAEAEKTAGVDTEGQTLANKLATGTLEEQIKQAKLINSKLWQDAYSEAVHTNIAQGLFPKQKELLAAQVVNTAQQTAESKSKVRVNEQDIINMREQVQVMRQEIKESIQRISQSQANVDLMMNQIKSLTHENNLTNAQQAKVEQETKNLLKTGDLLQYEKGLQDDGLRNPIVQSVMGIIENAAGGYGTGKGISGGIQRALTPKAPVGFKMGPR